MSALRPAGVGVVAGVTAFALVVALRSGPGNGPTRTPTPGSPDSLVCAPRDGLTVAEVGARLEQVRTLRGELEGTAPIPTGRDPDPAEVEAALAALAAPAVLDLVDCSEVPCVARLHHTDVPAIAAALRRHPALTAASVTGFTSPATDRPSITIVAVWGAPPDADGRIAALARMNALRDR